MALTKLQSQMLQSPSGGGSKNYLSAYTASTSSGVANAGNGDFEFGNTTGWSLFNTTLTGVIPTGTITAGASSINTFATTNAAALSGTYSLNVQANTSWTAGQGIISNSFFIDNSDLSNILAFSFDYTRFSGTPNFSGTSSNTFAVYLYDVTNSVWIQPAGVYNLVGNNHAYGTFQTSANTTQYRLAVICINTLAGGAQMYFDDFFVGPQITAAGYAGSDLKAYAPTIVGFGTPTNVNFFWAQQGQFMCIEGSFVSGTPTAVAASLSLPSGTIDPTLVSTIRIVGEWANSTTTNTCRFVLGTGGQSVLNFGDSNMGTLVARLGSDEALLGTTITFKAYVPIAGWSSNTVMSADTDTRVVALRTGSATSSSFTSTQSTIIFSSVLSDTHAEYNTSTGVYTIPVSGYYNLKANMAFGGTFGGSNYLNLAFVNITASSTIFGNVLFVPSGTSGGQQGSAAIDNVFLNAGTQIALQGAYSGTITSPVYNASSNNNFSVQRVTGPATIAASESVNANYSTSTTSCPNNTNSTIIYTNRNFDSHDAYNTSTGLYTIPTPGRYRVSSKNNLSGTSAANTTSYCIIVHNGTQVSNQVCVGPAVANAALPAFVTDTVQCLEDDTISIVINQLGGSTVAVSSANSAINSFAIEWIGNY